MSDSGEQWSPKIAPASTLPTVAMQIGLNGSPTPFSPSGAIFIASSIDIGVRIAIVPQLVPVANATAAATRKTAVGKKKAEIWSLS